MAKRERAWVAGLVAMYICLAVLLIMLLNPSPDRQSKEMSRVFFTASHVMISLCVGYGMTLVGAMMATQYTRYRVFGWCGGAVVAAIAIYTATAIFQSDQESLLSPGVFGLEASHDPLGRGTAV